MEKLVLRGIMYGADKVPDSWFEKVPGGYYKPKEPQSQARQRTTSPSMRARQQPTRSSDDRRHSDDDYSRSAPSRDYPSQSDRRSNEHKRKDSHRSRNSHGRYSDESDEDRYPERSRPTRDEAREYPEDPYRRLPQAQHNADIDGPPDRAYNPRSSTARQHDNRPVSPFTAAAAAVAGVAAAEAARDIKSPTPQQASSSDQYTGYVPYSNIYGGGTSPEQPFSSPPPSNTGSVQPTQFNQVTTSRTNPRSPNTSVVGGVLSPTYGYDRRYPDQRYDERYDDTRYHDDRYHSEQRYDPQYDDEYYNDRRTSRPSRPPMRRRSFDTSYDSRDTPRRSPSPRRPSNADFRSGSTTQSQRARGKSMSRIGDTFDSSQRALGYSAVGALTGGLIGSEVGKGPVPAAIGAVLGGLGANMFEARERKKGGNRKNDFARDEDDTTTRRRQRDPDRRERDDRSSG